MTEPREATRPRATKRLFTAIVLGCVAGVIAALILTAPNRSVKLPDGSILKLEGLSYGTNEFVIGRPIERLVYRLTHRRLSSKTLGIQFWPPLVVPSVCLSFRFGNGDHLLFHFTHAKDPPMGSSASGTGSGVIFNGTKIEVFADYGERLKLFGVGGTGCPPNKAYGGFSFDFPNDEAKVFRVRISLPNESGQFVQIAQFEVSNPAPKGKRDKQPHRGNLIAQ